MKGLGALLSTAAVGVLMETISSSVRQHRSSLIRYFGADTRNTLSVFVKAFKEGYYGRGDEK